LKTGELFDSWVKDCPIRYTSLNAPSKRDILGTVSLSVLTAGHKRYARIATIRSDMGKLPASQDEKSYEREFGATGLCQGIP